MRATPCREIFHTWGVALFACSFIWTRKNQRSWKELWLDKRDSASWLTFWAVLVIGGLGILLALIQVVLQVVQVATELKGSGD